MSPRNDEFHKVKTVNGEEIQVLDEGHLREVLVYIFKTLIGGGLAGLIGFSFFFFKIYSKANMAAMDIAEIREMRERDTTVSSARAQSVRRVEAKVDSLSWTLNMIQPQIADLAEDVRSLRRELRRPR